ncbi:MurR/RpiR family transcriptional regulator [Fusibacter bizertensis]
MINLLGLIEMYNTFNTNTVYHEVARCLLKNYRKLDQLTIQQIAELCNVSLSTLTRFYKKMDYPNTVSKFPELVGSTKLNYSYEGQYYQKNLESGQTSIVSYINQLKKGIDLLYQSTNETEIERMIKEMILCNKVIFIGCPMPQEVWRLQADLTLFGMESSAFLDPNNQYIEMNNVEDGAMLFYIHYCKPAVNQFINAINKNKHKFTKIVVLSNNLNHPLIGQADYEFLFDGTETEQDFVLLNICMNFIGIKFKEISKSLSM